MGVPVMSTVRECSNVVSSEDARLADENSSLTLWQAIKKWRRILLSCLALSGVVLLFGYDYTIVGAVAAMPQFQSDFGQKYQGKHIIPAAWLSLWSVAGPIGSMVGALICGPYQDRLGRKKSIITGCCLSAIAVGICYCADLPAGITGRRGTFLAGKFFQGVALGGLICTVQTYMSEILPARLRGPTLASFPVSIMVGHLIGAVVVRKSLSIQGPNSYKIPFASQWLFTATSLVAAVLLPESPTWLIRERRLDSARRSQKRLDSTSLDSETVIEQLLKSIDAEQEHSTGSTYRDCFNRTDRRRTCIAAFAHVVPKLSGIILLGQGSYFLQVVGLEPSWSLTVMLVGICLALFANICSIWTMNTVGRRPLSMTTFAISGVLWLGAGIAGCFAGKITTWYIAFSFVTIILVAGMGCWPACYVIAAEASSLHLRAKTSGIGWFVSGFAAAVFAFALPQIYNPDSGNLRGKVCLIFAVTCLLATVLVWLFVPEMKGRTAHEIDRMFQLKLPARRFKDWRLEDDAAETKDRSQSETSTIV